MRPAGSPPRFASDDQYDSPGKPWDNTDTKRAPSAGIMAQGRVPGTKAVPQHENYVHDQVRKFAIYQDSIEVQNWSKPYQFQVTLGLTSALVAGFNLLDRKFILGSEDALFSNKRGDADTWTAESLPGSGPPGITFIAGSGVMVAGGGPAFAGFLKYTSSTWALLATTAIGIRCAVQWFAAGAFKFMLGGTAPSTAHPVIITLASNMTTIVEYDKAMPSGYTAGKITHFIACDTNALSIAVAIAGGDDVGAGSGGLQTYHSTDAVTWTSNRITGITHAISDAWFDSERAAFYILDDLGNLFKSLDGITFSDTGTDVPIDTAKVNVLACMSSSSSPSDKGSGTWVSVLSSNRLGYSVDEGVTWTILPYLFDDAAGGQPYDLFGVRPLFFDGRFVVLAHPASGTKAQCACFSLRLL